MNKVKNTFWNRIIEKRGVSALKEDSDQNIAVNVINIPHKGLLPTFTQF